MHTKIDDAMVANSCDGVDSALKLLNIVGQNAKDQDNPVFLPLRDGLVIVGEFNEDKTEQFHAIGTAVAPANTAG